MRNYHGYQSHPINFRSKRKYFLHLLLDITTKNSNYNYDYNYLLSQLR